MITEKDLQAAIAECQGQKNPDARTCIKLAAYLTIKGYLFDDELPTYSYASGGIEYSGSSEFARAIQGKNENEVLAVVDELMTAVKVISPRLYDSVLRKLE